jgi:hypothetical protein
VLNHLREVLRVVPGTDQTTNVVLFGRQFDDRLVAAADSEGYMLIGPNDLYA